MNSFYFTFGSDPEYPYQGGWVTVHAKTKEQACSVFRLYFPDRTPNVLNCAFVYTEEEFKTTRMFQGLEGEFCHAELGLFEKEIPLYQYETELFLILRDGWCTDCTGSISVWHNQPNLDVEKAIRCAVTDWVKETEEGKKAWEDSCCDFNYGDLVTCEIPQKFCEKYGFIIEDKPQNGQNRSAKFVNHDSVLVNGCELEQ